MQKIKNVKIQPAGFTLIELLVVIAIIGLLAGIILIALSSAREKARDAKRIADVNQMLNVFELYFADHNSYPTTSTACVLGSSGCLTNLVPLYLTTMAQAPTPPDSSSVYDCAHSYGVGIANDYQYAATTGSTSAGYTITFCLGDPSGNLGPGIHTVTPIGFQ